MNKHTLVLIGAGGHAKVCYEIASAMGKWSEIIILDDNLENDYFKISGTTDSIYDYPESDFFVAIGSNLVRMKMSERLEKKNLNIATLVHPKAVVSPTVEIERGSVIMPGVIVNSSTRIGQGAIINTGVTIDHDNLIESYVHLSPGSHLAGNVHIDRLTWLGVGVNVINNVYITKNCIIGAGSTVIKNIESEGTYIGTPTKRV